ncbi:MAG: CHAT domain-containing protein [Acidobacteriota bacterium]|nr:CHAT domain-containing protein [Acidobacteriota bacterium]
MQKEPTRPCSKSWWRKGWFWPALGLAAAAICGFAYLGFSRLQPLSDERLLAQAYTKHRPSELRIPGALAVALESPTRAAGAGDHGSSELLKVKLRAQERLESNSNNAALRQLLGRIAIVEHDGETALRQLEMAQVLDAKLPRLKFDLGSAYFEIAETESKPIDYARAIDFYSQYLADLDRQDAVALFDRGLCFERESTYKRAAEDFEAALALEKDLRWREEIQQHLDRVRSTSSGKNGAENPPSGSTSAALLTSSKQTDIDYESHLDEATRNWLVQRKKVREVDLALEQLSRMGLAHGDSWLAEMLRARLTDGEHAAEAELASAVQENSRGDIDAALASSTAAASGFAARGNRPGYLRAKFELIYSLQRTGSTTECLAEAQGLLSQPVVSRYSWLDTSVRLEISSCHAMSGLNEEGLREAQGAQDEARHFRLPILGLRAASFIVSDKYMSGQLQSAWGTAVTALEEANKTPGTEMRRYQLLTAMESVAEEMKLPWTQAEISEAATEEALATGNAQVLAYAFEDLALRQLRIGATSSAGENFKSADKALAQLAHGPAATLYRADWAADRSVLVEREQGSTAALAALASDENEFRHLGIVMPKIHFYTEYALLLRQERRPTESLEKAWEAVASSEAVLVGLRDEVAKRAWEQQSSRAYDVLIDDLAESGQIESALSAWRWLRSASYRSDHAAITPRLLRDVGTTPDLQRLGTRGQLTLVYARLEDRYLAWSIERGRNVPIRMRWLTVQPITLDIEAKAFARLCADPNSSRADLAVLGNALYRDLLSPFKEELNRAGPVELDLDDSLSRIPFAALQYGDHVLGLEHALVFLQAAPLSELLAGSAQEKQLPTGSHVVVLRGAVPKGSEQLPDKYDESFDIAKRFPAARLETATLLHSGLEIQLTGEPYLQSLLRNADLVHYSGHSVDKGTETESPSPSAGASFVLARGSLSHCQLAVLAACRTLHEREDDADGVPSLARSLLSAGARNVLATQWDVDSRTTRMLMLRFYEGIANHQDFAEALRQSLRSVQSDPTVSHPYYWASFQLVSRSSIPTSGNHSWR